MVTALKGEAARYWLIQCAHRGEVATPENIAKHLLARFRPPSYHHNLMARLTALRMQSGNFNAYAEQFLQLTAQIPDLNAQTQLSLFLNGLAQQYRVQIEMRDITEFDKTLEAARKLDAILRTTQAGTQLAQVDLAGASAMRFQRGYRGRGFSKSRGSGHSRGYQSYGTPERRAPRSSSQSSSRSNQSRDRPSRSTSRPGSQSTVRDPAQRPSSQTHAVAKCFNCGRSGHLQRDCTSLAKKTVTFDAQAKFNGPSKARGGYSGRGRDRGSNQGNASR